MAATKALTQHPHPPHRPSPILFRLTAPVILQQRGKTNNVTMWRARVQMGRRISAALEAIPTNAFRLTFLGAK